MQTKEILSVDGRISEAFFDLLKEKPCKKITVSELTKKSGVNRSTFYRHYTDIFDLFEKTCDAVIADTVNTQEKIPPEKSKRYIESLCISYYEAATRNVEIIGVLYKSNSEVRFLNKVRRVWCDNILSKMKAFDIKSDRDLFLHVDKAAVYFILKLLIPLSVNSEYIFDKYVFDIYDNSTFDFSNNLLEDMMLLQHKSDFSSDLFRVAINFWSKTTDKVAPFSVKELCESAYISRSLFYTKYKGIYEFINEMAIIGLALLSRFILDCALKEIGKSKDAFSYIHLNESFIAAFKTCLNSDDRSPFIFEVYRTTHKYFFDYIKNLKGEQYVEQNYKELEKYIFASAYNIIESLISQNEEDFAIRLSGCDAIRKAMDF